jgi:RNA polymerase sigma factor (sigma-70 family)
VIADCQRRGWTVGRARDLAEEAVQEAMARTLAAYDGNPGRFDGYDHFRHSVTRTAINWARAQLRRPHPLPFRDGDDLPAPGDDTGDLEEVRACLDRLPLHHREILRLRCVEGLPLQEIADRLLPADDHSANARAIAVHRRFRAAREAFQALWLERNPDWEEACRPTGPA